MKQELKHKVKQVRSDVMILRTLLIDILINMTVNKTILKGLDDSTDQLIVIVFSHLPGGVPSHLHHVHLDVLANHLHQTNDPPEGGEYV